MEDKDEEVGGKNYVDVCRRCCERGVSLEVDADNNCCHGATGEEQCSRGNPLHFVRGEPAHHLFWVDGSLKDVQYFWREQDQIRPNFF